MGDDTTNKTETAAEELRSQESLWWGLVLLLVYLALLSAAPLLAHHTREVFPGFVLGAARVMGLVGFTILAIQVALGSRLKFIDRPWGLDSVMRFHKWMAVAAFFMLLLHPLTVFIYYAYPLGVGPGTAFGMIRVFYGGMAALAILAAVVMFSLLFKRLGIQYQLWRNTHKAAVAVVVVGFFHGLGAASEAMTVSMRLYFIVLFAAAMALFFYGNIYKKIRGRSRWIVESVMGETHDTYTLTLQPENGQRFPYRPGQFIFLRLNRPGRPSEEHPFTISSSPGETPSIAVTIKESGDFTDTISQTRPGDRALVDGPFGRFSFQFDSPESFVFIAGGVGITPILSMMRRLRAAGDRRRGVLVYANRTERDIIAREELDAMPDNISVHYVLDSSPGQHWRGYTGRVNAGIIAECAGDIMAGSDIYLCGPPGMMKSVRAQLRSLGVSGSRIHMEKFTL